RRKGRAVDGWLVIDKTEGVTSAQVVAKARWAMGAQKAGHAGTLDPLATGVLAIAFGEATKTVPYVTDALKAYRFTVRWGETTDTDDAEGRVIATSAARPTDAAITAALPAFTGEILQTPPQYSAVKVDGERAYALAREGETLELAARPLWVESLALTARPDADHAVFEMVCGKGGYVRSVARDLGAALGCGGHVTALRRLWSGPFDAEDAISFAQIDELRHSGALESHLLPVATGLDDIPALAVPAAAAAQLRQGRPAPVAGGDLRYGDEAWASLDGAPVAIGVYRAGQLHPNRVFNLGKGDPDVDHA
ncbi:MAG: tRNA pseudouridine(55) synthase TruB, partial [Rhodobacteraceae bacterium]